MNESLLRFDKVDISYPGETAVKQLSFAVSPGEILGIAGESGSGKSTLLRAAFGLLGQDGFITHGTIWYKDRDITKLTAKERRKLNGPEIGAVFQNAGSSFCQIRTVGAQLYEMMRAHRRITRPEFQETALELLSKLGFEDGSRILKSYPFELSGGMQQRVGIAAAMLLHPQIIFADEPTSALDIPIQRQVIEEMLTARSCFGTAIVLISHSISIIEAMADHVLVMRNGEAVEYGDTEQILTNPQTDYTKKLLKAVPSLRRK